MRLLRQNLRLVADDCHLATSLSRSLRLRSSRLLCTGGESPSPLLHSLGFRQLRRGLLLLQTMVLTDDGPRCSCRRCDSDESLARNLNDTRLSSTRPSVSSSEKSKATQMGPTRPETTQGSPPRGLLTSPGDSSRQESHTSTQKSRQGSDSPPRKRRSGDSPHPTRVAKGVILLPTRGDLETRLSVSRTTRLARLLSSEFLGLLVSPGDSPQRFSDYSSRQVTLLSASRTTRLARGVVTHPGRVAKGVILLPSRGLGSRTIRRPMRLRRHHIANTETISRVTRNIFVVLLWLFAGLHHKNVSSRLQYSAQPSLKRLLVFEAANIIDESSTTYSVCHGRRIISSTGRTYCRLPQWRLISRRQGKSSI